MRVSIPGPGVEGTCLRQRIKDQRAVVRESDQAKMHCLPQEALTLLADLQGQSRITLASSAV